MSNVLNSLKLQNLVKHKIANKRPMKTIPPQIQLILTKNLSYNKIQVAIIKHMKSKTIILSNENQKGRGILTIFQENDILECRVRLYNTPKLNRFCKIGIYHNNEVFSANLLEKNDTYSSSVVGNFNIEKDFYTAIIDTSKENEVILSGGTYVGFFFNEEAVFNKFERIEKENPNTNIYNYNTQETKTENERKEIEDCKENCDKCEKCVYKEFFYSHNNFAINNEEYEENETQNKPLSQNEDNEKINELPQEKTETQSLETNTPRNTNPNEEQISIVQSLIPQFQYIFENYPKDETLNNLIPNSRFVNINENSKSYSIGAIYEEEQMKYICYATLSSYNSPAPEELGEHYQWLPLNKEDPLSDGYYIVFQDTKDLKIVEL